MFSRVHLIRMELVARRNQDREEPDYSIFAGEQLVGRIYRYYWVSGTQTWWWGINTICIDATFPHEAKGYVTSFEAARDAFRIAFDQWLVWARAIPVWDPKRKEIDKNLKAIGG